MKHAYLIIAHNEPEILKRLLNLLDDQRNDIYLHVDKKSEALYNLFKVHSLRLSRLYVLEDRVNIKWGDVSQIKAELLLFEKAVRNERYAYLHLISGVDFPIKPQDYIHEFFNSNIGYEFVGFVSNTNKIEERATKVHLFTRYLKVSNKYLFYLMSNVRCFFLKFQHYFNITINKGVLFKKGCNWVSVTGDFASYLLARKENILKMYKYSICGDELFLQTILWNSPYKSNIYDMEDEYNSCMRLIDWKRGGPYIWTVQDLQEIMKSEKLFLRKLSWDKSKDLWNF